MDLLIGEKFHSIRQILGITQNELAKNIGISRATFTNIELGKQKPTFNQLYNLANYYHIPFDYFFTNNKDLIGFVNKQLLDHGKIIDLYTSVIKEQSEEHTTRSCSLCIMKDEVIKSQKELINQLKNNNTYLEEKLKDFLDNNLQKRKKVS